MLPSADDRYASFDVVVAAAALLGTYLRKPFEVGLAVLWADNRRDVNYTAET